MTSLIGVNDLASVLLQCFALILIGYLSGRFGLITERESRGLSAFVTYFSLPALIFQSLSTSDLSHINWYFVLSLLTSKTLVFISVVIITAILTKPSNLGKSGLFGIFCTQSNDFALGYPLLASLYGKSNPEFARYLYVLSPIQLVLLNPIGLFLMEIHRHYRTERIPNNNYLKILIKVLKQIIKNPIIFMTFLGILWNLLFGPRMPPLLQPFFEVLSNSFSATALFLLGLNLLGKFKTFTASSHILLVSLVLVMTKILILPLLNRVIIQNVMNSEDNQTLELSNFGFLYGTIPSAPTVFIFSLQYEFGVSSTIVSTAMVMSTVLSAPLMFVSANMIRLTNNTLPVNAFHNDLGQTMSYSSLISILCVIMTLTVLICGHKWRSLTHRCTIALAVSQLMIGIGGYLWSYIDNSQSLTEHYIIYHFQYVLAVGGVLSSRIWTAMLSLTLALLHWKSLCYVIKIHQTLSYLATFLTFILLLLVIYLPNNLDSDLIDPNFEFGSVQAYIAVIVLIICLIITIVGLITQQRLRIRISYYHSLRVNSDESEDIDEQEVSESHQTLNVVISNPRRGRFRTFSNPIVTSEDERNSVIEVEDIGSGLISRDLCQQSCSQERRKSCLNNLKRYRELMSEASEVVPLIQSPHIISESIDDFHQVSHHVFLLLTLLLSMLIGLTVSIGKLVLERPTGILIELEFLDILLNYGQGVITFLLFGLDMSPVLAKILHLFQKPEQSLNNCVVLPPIESIRAETKAKCEQFIAFHKENCIQDIVFEHQIDRNRCHVFRGKDFVDWILTTGIASNRSEAEVYGQHLLIGRIIQHLTCSQHFNDSTFLYKFN